MLQVSIRFNLAILYLCGGLRPCSTSSGKARFLTFWWRENPSKATEMNTPSLLDSTSF